LSQLQKERKALLKEVPRLLWRGPGHHMVIKLCDRQGDAGRFGCIWPHRLVFRHLARVVFKLDDDSQRAHMAAVIGQTIDHLLIQADLSRLPGSMLEMIVLQTIALKRMKSASSTSPAAGEVGMEISRIIAEWKGKLRMTNSLQDSAILADRMYYHMGDDVPNSVDSEDLSLALVYLQHQTRKGLYCLIANAHVDDGASDDELGDQHELDDHGEIERPKIMTESCTLRHLMI